MINTGSIRPRSQTFPQLAENYILSAGDSMNVKYSEHNVILDSPMEEAMDPMGRIDTNMITRDSSPGERCNTITPQGMMRPPPPPAHSMSQPFHPQMIPATSAGEAHQAMEVVMKFIMQQPDHGLDDQDVHAVGRVLQKLEVQHRHSVGG